MTRDVVLTHAVISKLNQLTVNPEAPKALKWLPDVLL